MHKSALIPHFRRRLRPLCRVSRLLSALRAVAGAPAGHGHQTTPGPPTPTLTSLARAGSLPLRAGCPPLVSAQTIYDLRSQGRGPRGFRVGRELRFRVSEIEAWLARMEQDDAQRHPAGGVRRPPQDPDRHLRPVNVRRRGSGAGGRDPGPRRRWPAPPVRVAAPTAASGASPVSRRGLSDRPEHESGESLQASSSFVDLSRLWLADLELRDLAEGTRQNYRDAPAAPRDVRPSSTTRSAEITTGRVEWFLKSQAALLRVAGQAVAHRCSTSMFSFALRHDAISRNPVQGTSPLQRTQGARRRR